MSLSVMPFQNLSIPSATRDRSSTPTTRRRAKSEVEHEPASRRQRSEIRSNSDGPRLILLAHVLEDKLRPSIPSVTSQTIENGPDVLRLLREGIDICDFAADPKEQKKKREREYIIKMRAELETQGIQVRDFAIEAEAKKLKMARAEVKRIQHELQENCVEVKDFAEGASLDRGKGKRFEFA